MCLFHLLYLVVEHTQSAAGAEGHNQDQHNLVGMDWDLLGMTAEVAEDNNPLEGLGVGSIDLAEEDHRRNLGWT